MFCWVTERLFTGCQASLAVANVSMGVSRIWFNMSLTAKDEQIAVDRFWQDRPNCGTSCTAEQAAAASTVSMDVAAATRSKLSTAYNTVVSSGCIVTQKCKLAIAIDALTGTDRTEGEGTVPACLGHRVAQGNGTVNSVYDSPIGTPMVCPRPHAAERG